MTRYRGEWPAGSDRVHVEGPLADGWWVYGLFLVVGGDLKLAELKVFPGAGGARRSVEREKPPELQQPSRADFGDWSGTAHELDFVNQPASISARLLRRVEIPEMLKAARDVLAGAQETADWLAQVSPDAPSADRFIKAIRRLQPAQVMERQSDFDLAHWANLYAAEVEANPRSPIASIAAKTGLDRQAVHDLVHRARRAELLTRPGQGRAGGQLTDRAAEILRRHGKTPHQGGQA